MSAALVLRDWQLDRNLAGHPEDPWTFGPARAALHGADPARLAREISDERAVIYWRKLRRGHPLPLPLVQHGLWWFVLRTGDLLQHWGETGHKSSPLWDLSVLLRWERFVVVLWYPCAPRFAIAWDTKGNVHKEVRSMPKDLPLRAVATWRSSRWNEAIRSYEHFGPVPPPIPGWETHTAHVFRARNQLRYDGGAP